MLACNWLRGFIEYGGLVQQMLGQLDRPTFQRFEHEEV